MRMYLKWSESQSYKTEIISISPGEVAGIKSCTIKVNGEYAYGWIKSETGVHRLVRKSPFDSGNRRHTSFASVFASPEIDNNIDIIIETKDLRVDVYRASGAGGQHVNKTESAVRLTHLPTGFVTQCQNSRSQHKNKETALKQLKAKLYALELEKQYNQKKNIEGGKADIGWGSQIRSYVLDQSRIKDLRTNYELTNTQSVLDGNINPFIEAYLKWNLKMDNKEEEHRLIKHRKEKLERIKESRNPYKNNYARTHQCKDVINDESLIDNSNIKVSVLGRMSSKRMMGKSNFAHIKDMSGKLQFFVDKTKLDQNHFSEFKISDIGDVISISGNIFLTKNKRNYIKL